MFLLVVVLNHEEKLNEVLNKFLEIGIKGATVVESTGMGQSILDCEVPLIGGLRRAISKQCRPNNVTIFSVVKDRGKIEEAVNLVEGSTGQLDNPGVGIAFALPLEYAKGIVTE